jgi:hypothetical protein
LWTASHPDAPEIAMSLLVRPEHAFAGVLDGTCAACGDGRRSRVRLPLAVRRADTADRAGELTWDGVEDVHAPA